MEKAKNHQDHNTDMEQIQEMTLSVEDLEYIHAPVKTKVLIEKKWEH
jgi:hypothetical protein